MRDDWLDLYNSPKHGTGPIYVKQAENATSCKTDSLCREQL